METDQERLHVWERAWKASAVRSQFLTKDERAQLDQLTTANLLKSINDQLRAGMQGGGADWAAIMQAEANRFGDGQRALEVKAGRLLKSFLADGKLRAFAFQAPRRLDDMPVDVTRIVVSGFSQIDWIAGHLTFQSMSLVELRFLGAVAIERKLQEYRAAQPTAAVSDFTSQNVRRPGRPSLKPVMRQVIAAMIGAGELDLNAPRRAQFNKIRARLAELHPDAAITSEFPSDETIRRAFSEVEET